MDTEKETESDRFLILFIQRIYLCLGEERSEGEGEGGHSPGIDADEESKKKHRKCFVREKNETVRKLKFLCFLIASLFI